MPTAGEKYSVTALAELDGKAPEAVTLSTKVTDGVPMATYGYARVSTADQAKDDRTSLDIQQRRIVRWAEDVELPLDRVFIEEGVSGALRLKDRPEGRVLDGLLQRGDNLAVVKMDRLFRSAEDALATSRDLRERGVNLYILDMSALEPITTSITAKLYFGMLALVAEFERDRIRERMVDGRNAKRTRGGFTGGKRPFGWRVDGQGRAAVLVPVPEEQGALAAIQDMAASGKSLRDISAAMTERGMPLSHQGVKRVLQRGGAAPAPLQ